MGPDELQAIGSDGLGRIAAVRRQFASLEQAGLVPPGLDALLDELECAAMLVGAVATDMCNTLDGVG